MKTNSFRLLMCFAILASFFIALITSARAASVTMEAESGTLGADFATGNDGGTQYITITSDSTATSPGSIARVATYSVTFPAAGTYDLYARVLVGPGGASDDSFFYGNGFGVKSPTSDGDWITVNSVNVGGFTNASDVVSGSGSAGITVWKWINLSQYTGTSGETPITFTVTAGNTNQTFQIGARENGFEIDKLVFGTSGYIFTVADLDSGSGGTYLPPGTGTCTVDWDNVHQQIDGFGGGVVFLNGSPPDPVSATLMNTAYGTNANQLALTLLRVRIDPNNYWSAALADAQKAVAHGAGVLATPWTPPASMKSNGSTIGGYLLPEQYTNYANYLNDFAAYMKANGAPLRAISVQNEPDYVPTNYEGCGWTATQLQTFFHNVGNLITNAPVMMPESASYNQAMSDPTLDDPVAVSNVDIIGEHLYGVSAIEDYPNAHNKGKPTWMTEFLLNDQTIGSAITTAKQIHDCLTTGNMSAYIWWKCFGNVNGLADASGVPQKRGFVMAQWSRFVRPGYYRIGTSTVGSAFVSAYNDTASGNFAIVAVNTNATTNVIETFNLTNFTAVSVTPWVTSATFSLAPQTPVNVTNASFTYELPAMSVVTFEGQGSVAPAGITISNVSYDATTPAFVLTWNSTSGATYSVFKTNVLGSSMANWPVLTKGYPLGGTAGGPLSYTDTTATAASAFYRVSSP